MESLMKKGAIIKEAPKIIPSKLVQHPAFDSQELLPSPSIIFIYIISQTLIFLEKRKVIV